METKQEIDFNLPKDRTKHIIKVIGVGGGGGNAVKNMYETGVANVGFVVCNTDSQVLSNSPVPVKVQLGEKGLGVGGDPKKGRAAAEESQEEIGKMFDEETQMVFITAGMGGGTGTGASPVIAHMARERGLLTIGVVTLPFAFEKFSRIEKALCGIEELKKEVDALLVINNERLLEIYDDNTTTIVDAFAKTNEILTTATKTIAEVITKEGIVSRDFCDVETVMKDSGAAIVSVGYAEGEHRILRAMKNALDSPLLNPVDITKTKRLLYIIYDSERKPVTISETTEINQFMDTLPANLQVLWGLYRDESLDEQVKVAIVATGFDQPGVEPTENEDEDHNRIIEDLKNFYYPKKGVSKNEDETLRYDNENDNENGNENGNENENGVGRERTVESSWLTRILDFLNNALVEET